MQEITISSLALIWFSAIILLNVLGIAIVQARETFIKKNTKNTLKPKVQPLISVVVIAKNNHDSIIHCLDSIRKSSVRKFDVIILDNKSSDNTRELVQIYKDQHLGQSISYIQKRKTGEFLDIKNLLARKRIKGRVVLVIKANQTVNAKTLRFVRDNFIANKNLGYLSLKAKTNFRPSIISLIEAFGSLTDYTRKTKSAKRSQDAFAFERDVVLQSKYDIKRSSGAGIENYVLEWRTILGQFKIQAPRQTGLAIVSLSVLAMMIYAFTASNLIYFLIPWVAATVYYFFLLLSDEYLNATAKIRLGFYLPIAYVYTVFFAGLWLYACAALILKIDLKNQPHRNAGPKKLSPLLIKL